MSLPHGRAPLPDEWFKNKIKEVENLDVSKILNKNNFRNDNPNDAANNDK